MGSVLSRAKIVVGAAIWLNKTLNILSKRLKQSPGIPVQNPTKPFWTSPESPISSEGQNFPSHADIVIIGTGITGTSVVYNILKNEPHLKVVMLEARGVCSGATARNGGHVNPPLYQDYSDLKKKFGEDIAKQLIQFRLSHFTEFMGLATAEDLLQASQCRKTHHFEVHLSQESYEEAKRELKAWRKDMPEEAALWEVVNTPEASEKFHFNPLVVGLIHGPGGAMHPYRFVTTLLSKLLERFPKNLFIITNTPCDSIDPPAAESSPKPPTPNSSSFYTLHTPRGTITTPHVIHTTNGYTSHLLPPFREKIIPARGTMSAQRPGTNLDNLSTLSSDGTRSFVFYSGGFGYDYLTQLPSGERELMLGGGWSSPGLDNAFGDVGLSDDSKYNFNVGAHLSGVLPMYFGERNWGKEAQPAPVTDEDAQWSEGRVKAVWSGILGLSADGMPWVGRLPPKLSSRSQPHPSVLFSAEEDGSSEFKMGGKTAAPGEWISAGYTGEGMVHAWMCGKALSVMVLGREDEEDTNGYKSEADDEDECSETASQGQRTAYGKKLDDWFPRVFRVTEERWKKADFAKMVIDRLGH